MYADKELDDVELREVGQHLAQCRVCNQAFAKQGAMDMLLKNHYSPEPPEGFLDSLWPSVSEHLDDTSGSDGAGSADEEVVFRTSPAMQILDIPERKPPETASIPTEAASEAPPPASSWRWPVALIMSTAIAVVGFLYYKKSQQQAQTLAQAPVSAESLDPAAEPVNDQIGAASQPAAEASGDGGMAVAALTPGSDGGLAAAESIDDTKSAARGRGRSKRGRRRARGGKKAEPAAEPTAVAAAPKSKAKSKARTKAGGGTALDNLLDDAIGGAPAPKAAGQPKAAAAAAPGSNLPDQLNMNQIRTAMNKIKGRVASCYDQYQVEGMAKVRFKISPTGKVLAPSIRGKFRGTDTGDCVMKAVKKANFPKFAGKPMTIKSYPFLLQ